MTLYLIVLEFPVIKYVFGKLYAVPCGWIIRLLYGSSRDKTVKDS